MVIKIGAVEREIPAPVFRRMLVIPPSVGEMVADQIPAFVSSPAESPQNFLGNMRASAQHRTACGCRVETVLASTDATDTPNDNRLVKSDLTIGEKQ
jgi:hypothetical protein